MSECTKYALVLVNFRASTNIIVIVIFPHSSLQSCKTVSEKMSQILTLQPHTVLHLIKGREVIKELISII